jgi:hypothetical protein
MGLLDHPALTEEGRKVLADLLNQILDQRLQLMERRISERRKQGSLDKDALLLVQRLEGAWFSHEPELVQRMRVLDTLMILAEVLNEVAPCRTASPAKCETEALSEEESARHLAAAERLVAMSGVEVRNFVKPDDQKFAMLVRAVFTLMHPEIEPSDRIWGAVEVIRRGPGPRPSNRVEDKWSCLSAMVEEMGLGKVAPRTLGNSWSKWSAERESDMERAWTRQLVRSLAGLDPHGASSRGATDPNKGT